MITIDELKESIKKGLKCDTVNIVRRDDKIHEFFSMWKSITLVNCQRRIVGTSYRRTQFLIKNLLIYENKVVHIIIPC